MALPRPLPDLLVDRIATRFRVIGDPVRIRLLERLMEGESSVQELAEAIGASQQNASKHLGVLLQAGIVGRRKEGNFAFYRIVDESVMAMCDQVCSSLQRELSELSSAVSGGAR
jgi:DNA-binding transcriptional ArsR family regulator